MVKIKTSSLIDQLKGSIGNTTFSNSRMGPFARTKVNPVRSSFTNVNSIQMWYSRIAAGWRLLSQSQKLAWQSKISQYTFLDKFNNPYTPSAWQLFLTLNMRIFGISASIITVAPNHTLLSPPNVALEQPVISTSHFLAPDPGDLTGANFLKFYASKWLPGSQNWLSAPIFYLAFVFAGGAFPVNLYSLCVTLNGRPPIVGEVVLTEIIKYNFTSGQVSLVQAETSIVLA